MKKVLSIAIALFAVVLVAGLFSSDFTYVGAAKCKMCHKTAKQGEQHPKWEASAHAKTTAILTTDAAKALAADAPDNAECQKCHAPMALKNAEFKDEGVTCEVCHGPGSDYKKMSTMKDHAASVAAGMTDYADEAAIKKQCMSCHENPHDKPFDFAAAWEKIKHTKPE